MALDDALVPVNISFSPAASLSGFLKPLKLSIGVHVQAAATVAPSTKRHARGRRLAMIQCDSLKQLINTTIAEGDDVNCWI